MGGLETLHISNREEMSHQIHEISMPVARKSVAKDALKLGLQKMNGRGLTVVFPMSEPFFGL